MAVPSSRSDGTAPRGSAGHEPGSVKFVVVVAVLAVPATQDLSVLRAYAYPMPLGEGERRRLKELIYGRARREG